MELEVPPTDQELIYGSMSTDFLRVLDLLARKKKFILTAAALITAVLTIVAFLLPNRYTSSARIIPPQTQQSGAASLLSGQLGSLASLLGGAGGNKTSTELYLGLLKSESVANKLISDFNLQKVYKDKTLVETRDDLSSASELFAGKDGIIVISVTDKDPKRAADMAKGYVDAVTHLNERLTLSEAAQRRVFYEGQLKTEKDQLADAEVAMRTTQERTGVIALNDQAKAIIDNVAKLRASIAAQEVEIQTMKVYATEQNPQLVSQEQSLAAMRAQLARLERTNSGGDGSVAVATGKLPAAGLEYIRAFREVKYHETLFEMLAKQLEMARIDEAKTSSFVQVVDTPTVPDKKSSPHRSYIILGGGLAAFFLDCCWVVMAEKVKRNPEKSRLLADLQNHLWQRSSQN